MELEDDGQGPREKDVSGGLWRRICSPAPGEGSTELGESTSNCVSARVCVVIFTSRGGETSHDDFFKSFTRVLTRGEEHRVSYICTKFRTTPKGKSF